MFIIINKEKNWVDLTSGEWETLTSYQWSTLLVDPGNLSCSGSANCI
jgi:hypothetical protein